VAGVNGTAVKLPDGLHRNLADAELSVLSWSASRDELIIRVEKTAAEEFGLIRFRGISHVNLPPSLTVESIEVCAAVNAPADLWNEGTPRRSELGDSDHVALVFGSFGGRYFVVAETMTYELGH
jgi:hypothetical protein